MRVSRILVLLLFMSATSVSAETIAVIGTGDVAKALGPEFAAQGHTIVYGSRQPDSEKTRDLVAMTNDDASAALPKNAVIGADIVVLAVPGLLVEEITLGLGDLNGKIIIDPTNPLVGDWESELTHGAETSNGEIIQNAAPGAHVVKAFNTLNWQQMVEPNGQMTISLVGNSDMAKSRVAALVSAMGLEPIDLGGIENAHWVEGLAMLWLNNRIAERQKFEFYLRPIE